MNIEILKCLRVRFKEHGASPSLASRRTRPPAEWFFFSFTVRIYSRYAGQDSMYCMGQVIPPPPTRPHAWQKTLDRVHPHYIPHFYWTFMDTLRMRGGGRSN